MTEQAPSQPYVVAALYHFVTLDNYQDIREPLRAFCDQHDIKGTLLLANEGINGTVAGSREGIDALLAYLKADARLAGLEHKESFDDEQPFFRMKVKLKKEIVTMGIDGIDPNDVVGTYVKPKDWNALISDPDVLLLDTRNDYEVEVGTFEYAVDPETKIFREFPEYVRQNVDKAKHKKVAMFCTGGIRCEKASSFMKKEGFEEVYHLEGGILKYLEEVPKEESLWKGECFVFDNRVTVDHDLAKGRVELCHACRMPVTEEDTLSIKFEPGVSCPRCYDSLSETSRQRARTRQKQMALAKEQGIQHVGMSMVERKAAKLAQKEAHKRRSQKQD
jgi:UPF0176 protein